MQTEGQAHLARVGCHSQNCSRGVEADAIHRLVVGSCRSGGELCHLAHIPCLDHTLCIPRHYGVPLHTMLKRQTLCFTWYEQVKSMGWCAQHDHGRALCHVSNSGFWPLGQHCKLQLVRLISQVILVATCCHRAPLAGPDISGQNPLCAACAGPASMTSSIAPQG